MNLLISNYDYSIKPFDGEGNIFELSALKLNKKAINNFRANGNIFVIATSRRTSSIKKELEKYDIKYDYLMTYNGRVIYDKNGNLIYASYINNDILTLIEENGISEIQTYDEYDVASNNIVVLEASITNYKNIREILVKIKENYPGVKLDVNFKKNTLTIRNYFTKADGITKLLEIEKIDIPYNNIYTIGNSKNDYEMLTHFNGYRLPNSNHKLMYYIDNKIPSLNKLVKKIERNI